MSPAKKKPKKKKAAGDKKVADKVNRHAPKRAMPPSGVSLTCPRLCGHRQPQGPARLCNRVESHPGGNPGANLESISHRCHPILVAFVWELTKETIHLPLGCLQGGCADAAPSLRRKEAAVPSLRPRARKLRARTRCAPHPGDNIRANGTSQEWTRTGMPPEPKGPN